MDAPHSCPRCGQPLAPDAPQGICPACLLKAGFPTGPQSLATGLPAGRTPAFRPPAPAQLAKFFPQLEIFELVGQGGMGAVYKARQPSLDRFVALKILPTQDADDPGFAERFAREARALARLNHPNIVAVYEYGHAGDFHFFVMEYVDGATLRQIERAGQLSPGEALQIVPQICEALQYAHDSGIVHRDIKPENILLDKKGRVKIADFGLAKIFATGAHPTVLTEAGHVMGTPHYMAPEQVEHPLEVDYRADIYSLGVVFYEMLTGELPLGRFAMPSEKTAVDTRLDDVVLRALEKEPAARYQQASAIKTDVETIAGGGDTSQVARVKFPGAGGAWRYLWAAGIVLAMAFLITDSIYKLNGIEATTKMTVVNYPSPARDSFSPTGYVGNQHVQVMPALGTDGYQWILQTEQMLSQQSDPRVRHVDSDGPLGGRDVHWSDSLHWLLAGLAWGDHLITGAPMGVTLEREEPWANTVPFALLILILPPLLARRFGPVPALLVPLSFVVCYPFYEYSFVGYFDHHGLAASADLLTVLFLIAGGGGLVRDDQARVDRLSPIEMALWQWLPNRAMARRWFIASAIAGGVGLWISAASIIWPLFWLGVAAVLSAVILAGDKTKKVYWKTDPTLWRVWGIAGACTSLFFYLLEYAPTHFTMRLEVNHPLYALAWFGAGDLIYRVGRLLQGRRTRFGPQALAREGLFIVGDLVCLSLVPIIILIFGEQVFRILPGTFLINLHQDYILEFRPFLMQMSFLTPLQIIGGISIIPFVSILAAGLFFAPNLPRPWKAVLMMAWLPALASLLLAIIQIRWLGICCAVSIPTLAASALIIARTRLDLPWNVYFTTVVFGLGAFIGLTHFLGNEAVPWIILGTVTGMAALMILWSWGNKTIWVFGATMVWLSAFIIWFASPAEIAELADSFMHLSIKAPSAGTIWLTQNGKLLTDTPASVTWFFVHGILYTLGGEMLILLPALVVGSIGVLFFKWRVVDAVRAFYVSLFLFFLLLVLIPFPSFTALQWNASKNFTPGVSELDLTQIVTRDVSQRLRSRLGKEPGVILSGPTTTTWMMYYGGFRGLGTLYWENVAGLKEAAAIYSAKTDEAAKALIDKNHVTHIVIYQWDAFAEEYARLGAGLPKPSTDEERKAQDNTLAQSFILKILTQHQLPHWLRPLPYTMPDHPWLKNSYVMIFEVVPKMTDAEFALRIGQWDLQNDGPNALDNAEKEFATSLKAAAIAGQPDYLPALVAQAKLQFSLKQTDDFYSTMQSILPNLRFAETLAVEDRVDLCMVLGDDLQMPSSAEQIRACLDIADENSLRKLSYTQLEYLVYMGRGLRNLTAAEQKVLDLGKSLLPASLQPKTNAAASAAKAAA